MSRWGRTIAVAFAAFTVASCSGSSPSLARRNASGYLNRALDEIQANSLFARRIDFAFVRRQAVARASHATSPAATYGAIRFALAQLHDGHALLMAPQEAAGFKASLRNSASSATVPTVGLVGTDGWVQLPSILARPDTPAAADYEGVASTIAGMRKKETCRWIVDLRDNPGGDMYPMLLAIRPLLAEQNLLGFRSAKGSITWAVLHGDAIELAGREVARGAAVAAVPAPTAVAVLTGPRTASSGEAVAIALRSRANARSFGQPTAGAPTSPHTSSLTDGALLRVADVEDVDVAGRAYDGPVQPDTPIVGTNSDEAVMSAAQSWLATSPVCKS